jgi:peptidoglycan/xylan/chitin deacetylase (PgdA/CDA1 family)
MSLAVADRLKRGLHAMSHYTRALRSQRFPGVAVLCYHGLRRDAFDAASLPFANLHLRESTFAEHCRVVREGCDPISLDEWRRALSGRGTLPARPVLITFDDGYRSVLTIGQPLLDASELPATVFVCTDPAERRRLLWFDAVAAREGESRVEASKSLDYEQWLIECVATAPEVQDDDPRAVVTPSEAALLGRSPLIEVGAHTVRHPILARASARRQREEIAESVETLMEWIDRPVRAFAYPNGRPGTDFTSETVALVRECGVDMAFAVRPAFAVSGEPTLERSRFLMVDEISGAELAHRLAYTWPR